MHPIFWILLGAVIGSVYEEKKLRKEFDEFLSSQGEPPRSELEKKRDEVEDNLAAAGVEPITAPEEEAAAEPPGEPQAKE